MKGQKTLDFAKPPANTMEHRGEGNASRPLKRAFQARNPQISRSVWGWATRARPSGRGSDGCRAGLQQA